MCVCFCDCEWKRFSWLLRKPTGPAPPPQEMTTTCWKLNSTTRKLDQDFDSKSLNLISCLFFAADVNLLKILLSSQVISKNKHNRTTIFSTQNLELNDIRAFILTANVGITINMIFIWTMRRRFKFEFSLFHFRKLKPEIWRCATAAQKGESNIWIIHCLILSHISLKYFTLLHHDRHCCCYNKVKNYTF